MALNSKVDYWLDLCDDDLITAKAMLETKRFAWMGFVCHLVVEKALKAVIANKASEPIPRTHDLPKLARIGGIYDSLNAAQQQLLRILMPLHLEARYPEYKAQISEKLTPDYCKAILQDTEAFLCWIKTKLGK